MHSAHNFYGFVYFNKDVHDYLYFYGVFFLRLALSGVLGGLIGFEREMRSKEAGIRTHFLVAVGATIVMLVSQYGFFEVLGPQIEVDPSRIAAQVVSGVGFLGAGIIFKEKGTVKGLSTAAGIWITAAIGLSIGSGMYAIGIFVTVLVLIAFEILKKISLKYDHSYLEMSILSQKKLYREVQGILISNNALADFLKGTSNVNGSMLYSTKLRVKVQKEKEIDKILEDIQNIEGIESFEYEIINPHYRQFN
ncbi:MgtC/SapB family protein [Clostridium sp.]|uniref:MgtC/SapB family protein n=1 Tax=Clostridium sp. TaxID=1506 RepID=UPI00399324DC